MNQNRRHLNKLIGQLSISVIFFSSFNPDWYFDSYCDNLLGMLLYTAKVIELSILKVC